MDEMERIILTRFLTIFPLPSFLPSFLHVLPFVFSLPRIDFFLILSHSPSR